MCSNVDENNDCNEKYVYENLQCDESKFIENEIRTDTESVHFKRRQLEGKTKR